jgi:hypothetical protein
MLNSIREKNNLPPVNMNMLKTKDDGMFSYQITFEKKTDIYFYGDKRLERYNSWFKENGAGWDSNYFFRVSYWGDQKILKDSLFESKWQFLVEHAKIDSFLNENIEPSLMFNGIKISFKWHRFLFNVKKQFERVYFYYPLADTLAIGSNLYSICNSLSWTYNFEKGIMKSSNIYLGTHRRDHDYGIFHWYGPYIERTSINEKTRDSLLQIWGNIPRSAAIPSPSDYPDRFYLSQPKLKKMTQNYDNNKSTNAGRTCKDNTTPNITVANTTTPSQRSTNINE